MKLTKLERIVLLFTIALVFFVIGFFAGRTTIPGELTLSQAEESVPPEETAVVSPTAEQSDSLSETEETEDPEDPEETELDLNSATKEQFMSLPGVGDVLAQRIVDYRAEHGEFHSIEELKNVSGIGDKTFQALKDRIKVEDTYENISS